MNANPKGRVEKKNILKKYLPCGYDYLVYIIPSGVDPAEGRKLMRFPWELPPVTTGNSGFQDPNGKWQLYFHDEGGPMTAFSARCDDERDRKLNLFASKYHFLHLKNMEVYQTDDYLVYQLMAPREPVFYPCYRCGIPWPPLKVVNKWLGLPPPTEEEGEAVLCGYCEEFLEEQKKKELNAEDVLKSMRELKTEVMAMRNRVAQMESEAKKSESKQQPSGSPMTLPKSGKKLMKAK